MSAVLTLLSLCLWGLHPCWYVVCSRAFFCCFPVGCCSMRVRARAPAAYAALVALIPCVPCTKRCLTGLARNRQEPEKAGDDCSALSCVHAAACGTLRCFCLCVTWTSGTCLCNAMRRTCSCGVCTDRRHCQLLAAYAAVSDPTTSVCCGAARQTLRLLSEPILTSAA